MKNIDGVEVGCLSESELMKIGNTACLICQYTFSMGEEIACLPCGHIFHTKCVDEWLVNVGSLATKLSKLQSVNWSIFLSTRKPQKTAKNPKKSSAIGPNICSPTPPKRPIRNHTQNFWAQIPAN